MNEFFQDLKGAFKHFKFTSPDIDSNTGTQKFLRGIRPIILASTFVMVIGIINSSNEDYKIQKNRNTKTFEEDIIQENYTKLRNYMRPIFLRYLDLTIDNTTLTNQSTIQIQLQNESKQ